MSDADKIPHFSKNGDVVELRGEAPRRVVEVLDAVWMARNMTSRTALVNEILNDWATKVVHEASVVARVAGLNPMDSESGGRRG